MGLLVELTSDVIKCGNTEFGPPPGVTPIPTTCGVEESAPRRWTSRPARRHDDSSGRWREWHTPGFGLSIPLGKKDRGWLKMLKSNPNACTSKCSRINNQILAEGLRRPHENRCARWRKRNGQAGSCRTSDDAVVTGSLPPTLGKKQVH